MTKRKPVEPKPEELHEIPTIDFEFKTPGQKRAWETIHRNRVAILTGKAGTAKTFVATAYALKSVMERRRHKEIVAIRPAVEAGERNGALPGSIDEKVRPFLEPIYSTIAKICGKDKALHTSVQKVLKTYAIGYIQGLTFENAVVILDEAQNLNRTQMRLFLTRLGTGSKLILCGDTKQSDIGRSSVLYKTAQSVVKHPGVGWFEFGDEDQMRDPLVNLLDDSMDELDSQHEASFS